MLQYFDESPVDLLLAVTTVWVVVSLLGSVLDLEPGHSRLQNIGRLILLNIGRL